MNNEAIEKRLQDLKNEFESINAQINTMLEGYNAKIDEHNKAITEIQKEAREKIDELAQRREQIRGAYTELMILVHPEAVPQPASQPATEEIKETVEEPVVEDKQENKKSVSNEDVAKIKNIVKEENKQDDVPEYLK